MKKVFIILFLLSIAVVIWAGQKSDDYLLAKMIERSDLVDYNFEESLIIAKLPRYPQLNCNTMKIADGSQIYINHEWSMVVMVQVQGECLVKKVLLVKDE